MWAGVQNLQAQLSDVIGMSVFAGGLTLVKKYLLNYSWRKTIAYSTLFLGVVDSAFVFCTIYDVVRNQYFFLGEDIIVMVPAAARFVVTTFLVVEMAPEGKEGVTYGMLTTLSNLGGPISRAVSNLVFGTQFEGLSEAKHFQADTPAFRDEVALSYAVSYACGVLALAFLYFLPDQKVETLQRRRTWPSSKVYAQATLVLTGTLWVFAIVANVLVMFPSTSCLKILGGSGCAR